MSATNELKLIEKKTLYKQVGEELREYIIKNGLQKGDRLPTELELARHLGVSRNSVREGIRYLETLGFIETFIKTGIVVKADNMEPLKDILSYNYRRLNISLGELYEARKLLEMDAAELAVKNIDDGHIQIMEKCIKESEIKNKKHESITEEDYFFHRTLFAASKNKVIEQFNVVLEEIFREQLKREIINRTNEDILSSDSKTIDEHKRILEAILARDIDTLKKEILLHLNDVV